MIFTRFQEHALALTALETLTALTVASVAFAFDCAGMAGHRETLLEFHSR